ncbi:MAG: hypothetical protein IJR29_09755 [Butyrivibrio sp.]|nr:hypothetical protein [Butyrivibrio sp.]
MGSGNGLLGILIQTLKSKMTGLVTKFKLYTNWNFIRTKIIAKIRDFFANLLGVKPRNKDDYYTIGRWMFSKRLMYALVIGIGVLSIWYITTETMIFKNFSDEGLKTYKYNSLRLRTAKGHVRITGKSGYLAYDGNVEKGYVEGDGTLYNPAGNIVYSGSFSRNKYEGNGTLNYDSGNLCYKGQFHENLFEGSGTLYRVDGTREYVGEFSQGKKNGAGVLYDSGENELYSGTFASDEIVFSELLGKSVTEVGECYKGHRELYTTDSESVAVMSGIGALYHATLDSEALDDEEIVDSVYVLSDYYSYSGEELETISELEEVFGEEVYDGNSNVILPEAIAINRINEKSNIISGNVDMDINQIYSDVAEVNGFDHDYVVYIHSFRRGDIMYSFVGNGQDGTFDFYYITGAEDDA